MTRDAEDASELIPAMPDDLAAAIQALSVAWRHKARSNWQAIGADGRRQYVQYLNRAHRHRTRAERCEQAALQLTEPGRGWQSNYGVGLGGWDGI